MMERGTKGPHGKNFYFCASKRAGNACTGRKSKVDDVKDYSQTLLSSLFSIPPRGRRRRILISLLCTSKGQKGFPRERGYESVLPFRYCAEALCALRLYFSHFRETRKCQERSFSVHFLPGKHSYVHTTYIAQSGWGLSWLQHMGMITIFSDYCVC